MPGTSHLGDGRTMTPRSARPAFTTLYSLLLLGLLGSLAFGWWEGFDGSVTYDDVEGFGDAYWPMNLLLFGPSYVLQTVAAAIFLVVLGSGRGQALALTGAVVLAVSGIVFALAATAEVLPFDWAVNHELMDEATARRTVERGDAYLQEWFVWVLVPMAGIALGTLVGVIGAIRSGGLPAWWAPLVVVVIVVAFAAPIGSVLGEVVAVVQCVLWAVLGWRGLRAATSDE